MSSLKTYWYLCVLILACGGGTSGGSQGGPNGQPDTSVTADGEESDQGCYGCILDVGKDGAVMPDQILGESTPSTDGQITGCQNDNDCIDDFDCTVDTCLPDGTCQSLPDDKLCGDDEVCDLEHDGCFKAKSCFNDEQCDDGIECTVEGCNTDTNLCYPAIKDDSRCDGGFVCLPKHPEANLVTGCVEGSHCEKDADCISDISCASGQCLLDICEWTLNDATCDDNNVCNGNEVCDPSTGCQSINPLVCDDQIACTKDDCLPDSGCTHEPSDEMCDDGVFCNSSEYCDPETGCENYGAKPACDDGVDCTYDSCDYSLDDCVHTPNDWLCDDGDFCNGDEWCDAKKGCQPAITPLNCDDNIDCTTDFCDNTQGCLTIPDDTLCDDNQSLTEDICSIVGCTNQFKCDAIQPCNTCPKVAYTYVTNTGGDTQCKLFVTDFDKVNDVFNNTPVTIGGINQGCINDFAWSPSGTQLAYTDDENVVVATNLNSKFDYYSPTGMWGFNGCWKKNIEGQEPTMISWSPDENIIAFSHDSFIYIVKAEQAAMWSCQNIIYAWEAGPDVGKISWKPDNTSIIYTTSTAEDPTNWIYSSNPDGTDKIKITKGTGPQWSPDNVHIAYYTSFETFSIRDMANNSSFDVSGNNFHWTPTGDKLLFYLYESWDIHHIMSVDVGGDNITTLDTFTDLSSIYGFSSSATDDFRILGIMSVNSFYPEADKLFVMYPDGSCLTELMEGVTTVQWAPK